jgi:hypothetical protein
MVVAVGSDHAGYELKQEILGYLRACATMTLHFSASAGRADARRRPPWAEAPGPAGFVARSLHTKGYARRSRLAIRPGSLQQDAKVLLRRPLAERVLRKVRGRLCGPSASARIEFEKGTVICPEPKNVGNYSPATGARRILTFLKKKTSGTQMKQTIARYRKLSTKAISLACLLTIP